MLKIGVIGIGNMGKNHARILSNISSVKLVGIADINEKNGMSLAKKLRTKFYKDYKLLIANENLNAISICVPTSYHYEVTKYCLNNNLHVLLEKPIASNISQGSTLIKLAKTKRLSLLVGHIERFNPAIIKVKDMIDKGDLGKVTVIMCRRVGGFPPQIKDANIAVDLAIHDIDITNYLLNETPLRIYVNKQKNHIQQREDSVEFFLKYKKTSAYIQANWISPVKIRKLNITGTEGYLELDYITQRIEFYKSNYSKFMEATKDFSDYVLRFSDPDRINISVAKKEPLKEELMFFIDSVLNNKPINSPFAVQALKIALHT